MLLIKNDLQKLKELVAQYHKILLVHGKSYEKYFIKSWFDTISHVDFTEFAPNPSYEDVCKGVKVFNITECDAIIAIGGGSTIDVAKCIKLFCKMDHKKNYLEQKKKDTKIPLFAIPTTAGTGSESTKYAVIYEKGIKQSIFHESILPDYAILIPTLLKKLPVYQKKCTMLDALCQAIESFWSINSNEESKEYSKKAMIKIRDYWKEYIEENNETAAKEIMEAANYSGQAINITETTAAHAMSYSITFLYKFPHGHAVAVCMIEVWSYLLKHTKECIDNRGSIYLKNILKELEDIISYDWYCELLKKLNIENPVARDKKTELEILVSSVNSVRLKNNPVMLGKDVLQEMYERILRE